MTVLKDQFPKERKKTNTPKDEQSWDWKRTKVNGEFLLTRWLWPSVFNTNQPSTVGIFYNYLLAKQRISQCTEHNKTNLWFSWWCQKWWTSSNLLPQRNKTKPEGKDCCDEAVPSTNPNPGVSNTPLFSAWFTRHHHDFSDIVSRNFSCCLGLGICTKSKSLQTSKKRIGWMLLTRGGEGSASGPQCPPCKGLNPHLLER